MSKVPPELLKALTDKLIADGRIVEAGFASLIVVAYGGSNDMPREQYDQLREAFFAGAQHLFSSMMSTLDEGEDPTPADLAKMDLIDGELKAFLVDFKKRNGIT